MHKPLEILWSPLALSRLREIRAYIAIDKPRAAAQLATRIVALVESLGLQPRLGHPASEPNVRQLVVAGTPYLILYRLRRNQILISTIHHASQNKTRV